MHHLLEILLNRQVPRFVFLGNAFLNSLYAYVLSAVLVIVFGLGFVTAQTPSQTKNWPNKPIKLIVGFPPGGGIDMVARLLQTPLQENLGQQVIIEYKPGAGGVLAASELMRSPPDGYTILLANIGPFVLAPNMMTKRPYDASRDFTWISQTSGSGFIAAVSVNHPANNLNEFITWAKANSDKANFASGGSGSITHLNGELLNQSAGLKMVHVPYKGSAPAVQDLIGGQTHLLVDVSAVLMPHINSGRLKAIYVTDPQRNPMLPNVAFARQTGYPSLETSGWQGLVGPPGMSRDTVVRLAQAIQDVMNRPEMKDKFNQIGGSIILRGPDEFTEYVASETKRWTPVIRASGAILD
jgi:tripartite-type tricarboxylate transporter receptor subunit TctC